MIPHPSRRTVITTASALALAVTATAGTAVAASHRDVAIEIDGLTTQVSGFFEDVDDVLRAGGITVGRHDLVAPSLDSAVADGQTVVVRTATEYVVAVDGKTTSAWSTADSVEGVLDSIESDGSVVMAADRSDVRAQMPAAGEGSTVSIHVDGTTIDVAAGADDTALGLLAKAGISTTLLDRVSFVSEAGALALRVERVSRGRVTETTPIPFGTEQREDDTLYEGQTKVLQEGADGSVTTTTYRETIDGATRVEVVLSTERVEPTNKIIAVGTKEREAVAASASSASSASAAASSAATSAAAASGDVWAALAQCEAGGNPATNTGNGYYGMYQFSLGTWQALGGTGLPSQASAAEQTAMAQKLQARSGWGQWPACARKLGLY